MQPRPAPLARNIRRAAPPKKTHARVRCVRSRGSYRAGAQRSYGGAPGRQASRRRLLGASDRSAPRPRRHPPPEPRQVPGGETRPPVWQWCALRGARERASALGQRLVSSQDRRLGPGCLRCCSAGGSAQVYTPFAADDARPLGWLLAPTPLHARGRGPILALRWRMRKLPACGDWEPSP